MSNKGKDTRIVWSDKKKSYIDTTKKTIIHHAPYPKRSDHRNTRRYDRLTPTINVEKEQILRLIIDIVAQCQDLNITTPQQIYRTIYRIIETSEQYTESMYEMFNISDMTLSRRDLKNKYTIYRIFNAMMTCRTMIRNVNYGFALNSMDRMYYTAQPYHGLRQPIVDGKFDDYLLTLILTTKLLIDELRDDDYQNILSIIWNTPKCRMMRGSDKFQQIDYLNNMSDDIRYMYILNILNKIGCDVRDNRFIKR